MSASSPQNSGDEPHTVTSAAPYNHETADAMPARRKRSSKLRETAATSRSTSRNARGKNVRRGQDRPPSRNKTIKPRDRARSRALQQRPLNKETRGNRLTLPTVPQRTADHPEQTAERGNHDRQTSHEDSDAWVDDEPLHREIEETRARTTTTRNPVLEAHTARVAERARKRNTIA